MMSSQTASSSGKVILSGEMSAVLGKPGIVCAISLSVSVRFQPGKLNLDAPETPFWQNIITIFDRQVHPLEPDITFTVSGDLPIGSGLGSSAAMAHAAFKALAQQTATVLTKEQLFELVQLSEQHAHGTPSGMDALAVTQGGVLQFQRQASGIEWHHLDSNQLPTLPFFLIQSGRPTESTREMVSWMTARYESDNRMKGIITDLGQVTKSIIQAVKSDSFDQALIRQNQQLLDEMGIVGDRAKAMVKVIEDHGGVAKVTGAGGRAQGSGMLLALHDDPAVLTALIAAQKWESYPIQLGVS